MTASNIVTLNTKFRQLILRKIIKIDATKCTKFDFGWGSAPDPAGGAYSAPPDPLAGFKGPTSRGAKGRGKKGGTERGGRVLGKEGKKGIGEMEGRGKVSGSEP